MDNVYEAVKPFYNFAKVLGLFPISFEGQTAKREFKTRKIDVALTFFSLLLFVTLFCARMENIFSRIGIKDSDLQRIVFETTFTIMLFTLLIQFVLQISKRVEIIRFLKLLHDFDIEVRKRFKILEKNLKKRF